MIWGYLNYVFFNHEHDGDHWIIVDLTDEWWLMMSLWFNGKLSIIGVLKKIEASNMWGCNWTKAAGWWIVRDFMGFSTVKIWWSWLMISYIVRGLCKPLYRELSQSMNGQPHPQPTSKRVDTGFWTLLIFACWICFINLHKYSYSMVYLP